MLSMFGPVENSQNEFPTGPGTRTERCPQAPHRQIVIKKRNKPENGRHDVTEVAPDQAKKEWLPTGDT
jgi:hypothetical protein